MTTAKQVLGHALIRTDSAFEFTMDSITGELEIPDGIPMGTIVHYVERIYFADHTQLDQPKEITI